MVVSGELSSHVGSCQGDHVSAVERSWLEFIFAPEEERQAETYPSGIPLYLKKGTALSPCAHCLGLLIQVVTLRGIYFPE
jgi:hypothetical protein